MPFAIFDESQSENRLSTSADAANLEITRARSRADVQRWLATHTERGLKWGVAFHSRNWARFPAFFVLVPGAKNET